MNGYRGHRLLLDVLAHPERLSTLDISEWEILIGAARQTRLLARLEFLARRQQLYDQLPQAAVHQLDSAATIVRYHQRRALWELNRIKRVLDHARIPFTLLKGSAYLVMELELSHGREMRDVDLLIQKDVIENAEQVLIQHGWGGIKLDAYDQQYYRQWMHELPPMRHTRRVTEVDLHHTVLPLTSRLHPDANKLLAQLHSLQPSGFTVLNPQDMVLHCAVHLFHDGALDRDLRDLVDLSELFQHFGSSSDFWDGLVRRANELELGRPLFYALHFTRRMLNTEIPEAVQIQARHNAPTRALLALMNPLIERSLLPSDPHHTPFLTAFARWLLYLRSHWLRMPPLMLARHLFHKGVISNIHNRRRLFE